MLRMTLLNTVLFASTFVCGSSKEGPSKLGAISVRALGLHDAAGNVVGLLSTDNNGQPYLKLGKQGKAGLLLSVFDKEPSLEMSGATGKEQVVMQIDRTGEAYVKAISTDGNTRIAMVAPPSGNTQVTMLGPDKETTGQFLATANGSALRFGEGDKSVRVHLGVTTTGQPWLGLFDKKGLLRVGVGAVETEDPVSGNTTQRSPGSIIISDVNGRQIWAAP